MERSWRSLMIILGVALTDRLNSVLSFSSVVTNLRDAKMRSSLKTARTTSTTIVLRGKAINEDTRRSLNNKANNYNKNNKKSTVGIIGGGISGLSCARHLQHSYDVTVYDTGRLRPGGRASSRQPNDRPKDDGDNTMEYPLLSKFRYDHAAQFITATTPTNEQTSWRTAFDRQVQDWIDQDVLRESPPNSMYVFERETANTATKGWNAKCLNPTSPSKQQNKQIFCYPTRGMSSLIDAMVMGSSFDVQQDVWVSPSSGVRYQGPPPPQGSLAKNGIGRDSWSVRAKGRTLGNHDHLIVAHNGKCADRLMSKTPARDVHRLLRTNFNDRVPQNGGQKMTLNSIYSLTFCVKKGRVSQMLPKSFVGGFVQNHPKLGLVTCQTNKYPINTYNEFRTKSNEASGDENLEVWTILSTASFAKKNKAPQEFLPENVVQNVTQMLVDSLEKDLLEEIPDANTQGPLRNEILESRVQLWGAAVPLNVWRGDAGNARPSQTETNVSDLGSLAGFIHDPRYQVGVCGDWLLEASIAGAWTSGRRMAQHLIDTDHSSDSKYIGFKKGHFEPSQSVRQLGLASLEGPMLAKEIMHSTKSSSQTTNNRRTGNNNRKSKQYRKRSPSPSRT